MCRKCILVICCLGVLSVSCNKWSLWRRGKTQREPSGEEQIASAREGGTYSFEGILTASEVYLGGPNAPKRFMIRDPATRVIRAYVQSTNGAVKLYQYENQLVKVLGKVHRDKVSGHVIEATEVSLLEEAKRPESPQESSKETPEVEGRPATQPQGVQELIKL